MNFDDLLGEKLEEKTGDLSFDLERNYELLGRVYRKALNEEDSFQNKNLILAIIDVIEAQEHLIEVISEPSKAFDLAMEIQKKLKESILHSFLRKE